MADGESVISRVARILNTFDRDTGPMSLSMIANRSGLPLPTVYRLVTEMTKHGLLERNADKDIQIGVRLWEVSARANRVLGVRDAALPFMEDLQVAIREVVALAVLEGGSALYLERLAAADTVLDAGRMAERHDWHASSCGLVLVAFSPPSTQEVMLSGPLKRHTDLTVTNPAELRRVLAEIRRQTYAIVPGIGRDDSTGMAVPVFGAATEIIASLSVIYRRGEEKPQRDLRALFTAASGISRTLGRRGLDRQLGQLGLLVLPFSFTHRKP